VDADLDVVGIGNALVDVLVETAPAVVEACGLRKGSMTLMPLADAERIHARVGDGMQRSGGSAANTIAGLASMGSSTGFVGVVADDTLGETFVNDLRSLGVVAGVARRSGGTGRCLILVTPDAERTMCTSLGVAAELGPAEIDGALLSRARVTYLEGYLFDLPPAKEAFRLAIVVAHGAGRRVAMSLSDPWCVARHRDDFARLVAGELDLLFANEAEVRMLADVADDASLDDVCGQLRRPGLTVTVTLGADGALVFEGDGPIARVPAEPVPHVVDTTGAGDLYAAGFLHGWTHGAELERCARLGCVAAAEVISHVGARPEADLSELARQVLDGAPGRFTGKL
jgi:sugar/nucleoside kinase (ribokinase family)